MWFYLIIALSTLIGFSLNTMQLDSNEIIYLRAMLMEREIELPISRQKQKQHAEELIELFQNKSFQRIDSFSESAEMMDPHKPMPPLFQAIFKNDISRVKELCNGDETVHMIEPLYYYTPTPLLYAMQLSRWKIAKYLIFAPVNIECKDNFLYIPFLSPSCAENYNIMEQENLIEAKGDFNQTPIDCCNIVSEDDFQIATQLIYAGASILAPATDKTQTYIDSLYEACFSSSFQAKVISLVFNAFKSTIEHNDLESFKALITHNTQAIRAGIEAIDENKHNLLHLVAYKESYDKHVAQIRGQMAVLLIEKNVNINAQNKWGLTPLHVAINSGNIPVIKELLYQLNKDELVL